MTKAEPFVSFFGLSIGEWGVNVFFFVSGFLIAKSWFSRQNLIDFVWARVKRIYPALWSSTLFHILVASVFWTYVPMTEFLSSSSTVSYLFKNSTMLPLVGAQLVLPGTFKGWDGRFNVPLWTLPVELQMYGLLAVLGVTGILRWRGIAVVMLTVSAIVWWSSELKLFEIVDAYRFRLMFFFFIGVAFFSFSEQIVVSSKWMMMSGIALLSLWLFPKGLRVVGLAVLTPGLVCWAAYIQGGVIRKFNRMGDYSYGLYIFAFPLQVFLFREMIGSHFSPYVHFVASEAATLLMAIPSWHFIEKRALNAELPPILVRLRSYCSGSKRSDEEKR